jgi:6-phosphofructokinase 1
LADAGQRKDASGNVLHGDIGVLLKEKIQAYFKERGISISLKYMDPSYYVRSAPANSEDALLCDQFARHAVHAAMTGRTDLIIGFWNTFIHVPMVMATAHRRKIEQESLLWSSVLSSTGQPAIMM